MVCWIIAGAFPVYKRGVQILHYISTRIGVLQPLYTVCEGWVTRRANSGGKCLIWHSSLLGFCSYNNEHISLPCDSTLAARRQNKPRKSGRQNRYCTITRPGFEKDFSISGGQKSGDCDRWMIGDCRSRIQGLGERIMRDGWNALKWYEDQRGSSHLTFKAVWCVDSW